jgi:hypothetical protein
MAPTLMINTTEGDEQTNNLMVQFAQALLKVNNPTSTPASHATDAEYDQISEREAGTPEAVEEVEICYKPPGTISEAVNLYEGKPDNRGKVGWTKVVPVIEEPPENAESAQYALLIRNKICYDGRKKFEIDSLVVQSERLRGMITKVFEGYPGLSTELDRG